MNYNELYHYGVPGMKWGQRKTKVERITDRAKKRGWSEDATEVAKIKTKKINQMSNDDLKKVTKRDELTSKYKEKNPNAIKKGIAIAAGVAAALGTITLLHRNSKQVIDIGKNIIDKFKKKPAITSPIIRKFVTRDKRVSTPAITAYLAKAKNNKNAVKNGVKAVQNLLKK